MESSDLDKLIASAKQAQAERERRQLREEQDKQRERAAAQYAAAAQYGEKMGLRWEGSAHAQKRLRQILVTFSPEALAALQVQIPASIDYKGHLFVTKWLYPSAVFLHGHERYQSNTDILDAHAVGSLEIADQHYYYYIAWVQSSRYSAGSGDDIRPFSSGSTETFENWAIVNPHGEPFSLGLYPTAFTQEEFLLCLHWAREESRKLDEFNARELREQHERRERERRQRSWWYRHTH